MPYHIRGRSSVSLGTSCSGNFGFDITPIYTTTTLVYTSATLAYAQKSTSANFIYVGKNVHCGMS